VADRFDLKRFIDAQAPSYDGALAEIRRGAKRTHWMWYVFPQLAGLGHSATAIRYALPSLEAAQAYLDHPLLGARYRECVSALQDLIDTDAGRVFGAVDAMKLRSSLTLFAEVSGETLFLAALDRWFAGEKDGATLHLLEGQSAHA
jgi:uncharacterized protein (DUF1810 family)